MRIVMAADHAGFELKEELRPLVESLGHTVIDVGTFDEQPVDYPDFAEAVALKILEREAERGILVCGSGIGASVAANKIPGVRAGLCHDSYSAHQGVEHDDMNVLVLGGRVIGPAVARELTQVFLAATFSKLERHARRLEKVVALESKYCGRTV